VIAKGFVISMSSDNVPGMPETGKIIVDGREFEYPVLVGTEEEKAIDVRQFRKDSGYICYDEGFGNTGSCESAITFIDGEKGILRYRGYPIQELAQHSNFIESAYLIIYGELPTEAQMSRFRGLILGNASIHQSMFHMFESFPPTAHPMAILSAMLNSLGCYYPEMASNNRQQDLEHFDNAATILLSKVRTLAAMSFRARHGRPFNHPRGQLPYCANFLHMMFTEPYSDFIARWEVDRALNLFLLLHADHEQNCSTSTVRMVASGGANLFASAAAGVCALWGPAHGGANEACLKMLEEIGDVSCVGEYIARAKDKNDSFKLMGFGHRVYKNFDPRAKLMGKVCADVLGELGLENDRLFKLAKELEKIALEDPYFVEKKLYPNVDFYSGIVQKALGIPTSMFTCIFALARTVGWITQWEEMITDPEYKIGRPRQLYVGAARRDVPALAQRP